MDVEIFNRRAINNQSIAIEFDSFYLQRINQVKYIKKIHIYSKNITTRTRDLISFNVVVMLQYKITKSKSFKITVTTHVIIGPMGVFLRLLCLRNKHYKNNGLI